jgi:DNA-binding response OmpR family regulator
MRGRVQSSTDTACKVCQDRRKNHEVSHDSCMRIGAGDEVQLSPNSPATPRVVALFNASDDTVEMVERMLGASGVHCLVNCRFADLRKGVVDFARYLGKHDPQVVIFDISPPYEQNWAFFRTLRDNYAMLGRGLVLTTTNKNRLDEVVGHDSLAIEVVGKPYDLQQIMTAITGALEHASVKGR